MNKTVYVPVKYQEWLEKNSISNAGPNASISGMKKKFWGKNSYIVKCGQFIYLVSRETYYTCLTKTYSC